MSEQTAIQQVLNGNTGAFRKIVEAYSDRVFAFIERIVRQPMDAEEIAEDVLVKAYQHLAEYSNTQASFWTWLCSIAYNESLNHLRKTKPTMLYLDDNTDTTALHEAGIAKAEPDTDPRINQLNQAIARLSADDRTLIQLYYYDDKSISDIAYIIGQTENNVTVRLHRIRKRLHDDINKSLKNENTR